MKPGDQNFIPTIDALMKDLAQHIKEEEADDLPKLEKTLLQGETTACPSRLEGPRCLSRLASIRVRRASHALETAIGLVTAPIDQYLGFVSQMTRDFDYAEPVY